MVENYIPHHEHNCIERSFPEPKMFDTIFLVLKTTKSELVSVNFRTCLSSDHYFTLVVGADPTSLSTYLFWPNSHLETHVGIMSAHKYRMKAIEVAYNMGVSGRTKDFNMAIHYFRDCVQLLSVIRRHVLTKHQRADIFTKTLDKTSYIEQRDHFLT